MQLSGGEFKVKFRGVRGSYPTPSGNMLKYGGNTACVEVNVNGYLVIIDAGTGIISLGNELVKNYIASGTDETNRTPVETLLLISHAHHDHIQGFSFFKPVYIGTSKINVFGSGKHGNSFSDILAQSLVPPYSPIEIGEMAARINVQDIKDTQMIVLHPEYKNPEIKELHFTEEMDIPENAVTITCIKSYAHPKDGVLIFKISWNGKSVVYATDKESYIGVDSRLVAFARYADLLIHDAQYMHDDYISPVTPKQGYGHSTPEMAVETAKMANVKKLVLYHHDPSYEDKIIGNIEENIKKQFYNTMAAYEGLEIDLLS